MPCFYLVSHWGTNLSASDGGGDNCILFAKYSHTQEWEKFTTDHSRILTVKHRTYIGDIEHRGNGLCAVKRCGKYLCVFPNGETTLQDHCESWELFRMSTIPDPGHDIPWHDEAGVRINIYRFSGKIADHSGIVVNGKEYYFDSDSRVKTCNPQKWNSGKKKIFFSEDGTLKHHLIVDFHGNGERAQQLLDGVRHEWENGRQYDLFNHNCNHFVKAVCKAFNVAFPEHKYRLHRA